MSLGKSSLEWKFTQVFGDKSSIETVVEEDIISAARFTLDGKYLAIGDNAGRIVIFEHKTLAKAGKKFSELNYKTEFQSHFKEFDCLKSVDIEPKINAIEFLPSENEGSFVLTSNDKTIKLWKINEKMVKKSEKFSRKANITKNNLTMPRIKVVDTGLTPSIKRTYPMLHNYNINSISSCCNNENFLSADDLTVNLWSLSVTDKSFTTVDIAPKSLNEISEVITAAKFDPQQDTGFSYSTSKGCIRVCDLRTNSKVTNGALSFEDESTKTSKNFFSDFIKSVCDFNYLKDPNHILSRTLLTSNVWDKRSPKSPLLVINLYDPLQAKLCLLYEKELIFDKFDVNVNADSTFFVTGMYNNCFHICDMNGERNTQFELNFKKKTIARSVGTGQNDNPNFEYDITKRVLRTVCHPQNDVVVVASFNCLFVYNSI